MISAALRSAACHGNRDLVVVTIRLPVPDTVPIFGLGCAAHPLGTRISGTATAGEGGAASVLLGLRELPAACRGARHRGSGWL